jgi:hypothetical protein
MLNFSVATTGTNHYYTLFRWEGQGPRRWGYLVFTSGPYPTAGAARDIGTTLPRLFEAHPSHLRVETFFDDDRLYLEVAGVTLCDFDLSTESNPRATKAEIAPFVSSELNDLFRASSVPDFCALTSRDEGLFLGEVRLTGGQNRSALQRFRNDLLRDLSSGRITLGVARAITSYVLRAQSVGGTYTFGGTYPNLFEAVRAGASLLAHAGVLRVHPSRYDRDLSV